MHHSSNLFLLIIVLTQTILVLAQTNNSALYFPSDNEGNYHNHENSVQITSADLESLRGTTRYEKFVNDIISNGISRLTVALNRLVSSQAQGSNVVFSPLSISTALALVLLGSNGVTFKELSEFMGLTAGIPDLNRKSQIVHEQFSRMINILISTSGFSLGQDINVATAVFVQSGYPIRPLYRSTAEELYQSSILNVDFHGNPTSAQLQVNQWVEKNTNGKIKNILNDQPSSVTKVILASALYFKAEWEQHFINGGTKRRPYYVNGRNSPNLHELDMMANGGDFPYHNDPELGCEILGLPYKGNRSTMYIIMPYDSNREKLHQFESKLTGDDLEKLVNKTKTTEVVMLFPRMMIESMLDLKRTLELLGVRSLFNPREANLALLSPGEAPHFPNNSVDNSIKMTIDQSTSLNLSNSNQSLAAKSVAPFIIPRSLNRPTAPSETPFIGPRTRESLDSIRQLLNQQSTNNHFQNPGLYADQVIHKVYMDITEKGTEAAAATSVSLSRDNSKVTFRVDVPFIYFIRHEETKTILFWGSIVLPTPNYQTIN